MSDSTNWYAGPSDISLTNASAQILTPAEQKSVLEMSNRLLTPSSLAQAFATKTDYDRVKHLLTAQDNETYDVIPAALADGGRPKYNLNDLATNASNGATAELRANYLADIISSNLNSFASRDPSLRGVPENEMRYLTATGRWNR